MVWRASEGPKSLALGPGALQGLTNTCLQGQGPARPPTQTCTHNSPPMRPLRQCSCTDVWSHPACSNSLNCSVNRITSIRESCTHLLLQGNGLMPFYRQPCRPVPTTTPHRSIPTNPSIRSSMHHAQPTYQTKHPTISSHRPPRPPCATPPTHPTPPTLPNYSKHILPHPPRILVRDREAKRQSQPSQHNRHSQCCQPPPCNETA